MQPAPKERRQHPRFEFDASEAWIEFGYPRPCDHQCRMRVRDVSVGGISFELEHELPGLGIGTNLDNVVLRIGNLAIKGDVVVMRLTTQSDTTVCGGIFYPQSDNDSVKLDQMMTSH
ncbi:PilZ domain-containing protein [Moorena bouillonii]|uniref:PilZ domain-containing protein n=1 Tax=Moorena bouillonii TaxID=207920 RepID=UPI0007F09FB9|nr:PilZ domain-containing protein [Moorena bouillonii]ANM30792.1 hypothetical protein ABI59_16230 [Acidobacteria bacterium Mor1]